MIEQIINWWNNLPFYSKIIYTIWFICGIGTYIEIKLFLRNIRKTTTQKYREGLIKK